ncbi:MAG: hypothetical protein GWO20_18750, partial [Candidatus Korarchaeota archaeon]|nr:hypothetical protein [Candidatus Korarchaeota archaeon]
MEKLNIALEKTNNLLAQMNDFTAENDSLLKEFIKLKTDLLETTKKVTTYDQIIKPDPERKDLKAFIDEEIEKLKDEKIKEAIDKSIESLANSIITFDSLETRSKSDTVTIRQKFELWKDSFRITDIRRTNANIDAVLDSIARYDSLMERWASITTVDGFVTCDNVNVIKDKKDKLDISPIGDTTKFNPGKVYVWARVNAPEDETLKLVWLNSKGDTLSIVHKSGQERLWASLKVEESNGYRI